MRYHSIRHTQFQLKSLAVLALMLMAGLITAQANTQSRPTQPNKSKLVFHNEDEVKAFVAENLKEPLPDDYQIPSYITSELPLTQVYDTIKARYPGFYGKTGDEYIRAIMADPDTYLKLNMESKAIRKYYDRNYKN